MKCSGCFKRIDIEELPCMLCGQEDLCSDCITEHEENGCGEVMEDPPIRASDVLSPNEMNGMKSIW